MIEGDRDGDRDMEMGIEMEKWRKGKGCYWGSLA